MSYFRFTNDKCRFQLPALFLILCLTGSPFFCPSPAVAALVSVTGDDGSQGSAGKPGAVDSDATGTYSSATAYNSVTVLGGSGGRGAGNIVEETGGAGGAATHSGTGALSSTGVITINGGNGEMLVLATMAATGE